MSNAEKEAGDLTEVDSVDRDDDGKLQVTMEALQKGGNGDVEGLTQKADDE